MQPTTPPASQASQPAAPPAPQPAAQEPKQAAVEVKILQLEESANKGSGSIRPEMRPHAFVIMPFGKKKGSDGAIYDFNTIYTLLIKPTLEIAGFEPFRADEETTSGDILTDMFQELLLADLCIVDMSIDNANVFYELGIRHAFRKRGVVHIQAGRAYMPFDVFNVRTIPYHITPKVCQTPPSWKRQGCNCACSPQYLASEVEAIHSPIFNLLMDWLNRIANPSAHPSRPVSGVNITNGRSALPSHKD